MTTSKVKTIKSCDGDGVKWNGTYFHNLEMDNGDKINIGKKKEVQVGWELTYEIIETGQQEYQKAKAVKPEETSFSGGKSKDAYIKGIEVGHAVNNAVNMLCAGLVFDDVPTDTNNDNKIYLYAKHIMKISEKLKDE